MRNKVGSHDLVGMCVQGWAGITSTRWCYAKTTTCLKKLNHHNWVHTALDTKQKSKVRYYITNLPVKTLRLSRLRFMAFCRYSNNTYTARRRLLLEHLLKR